MEICRLRGRDLQFPLELEALLDGKLLRQVYPLSSGLRKGSLLKQLRPTSPRSDSVSDLSLQKQKEGTAAYLFRS